MFVTLINFVDQELNVWKLRIVLRGSIDLIRPRMCHIQEDLREKNQTSRAWQPLKVYALPYRYPVWRRGKAFTKNPQGEAVVVFRKQQDHKKTSSSDQKLTRTLPATPFHTSFTPLNWTSAVSGKDKKLTKLNTQTASRRLVITFRTFLLRPRHEFILTWHYSVHTRGANRVI